MAPESEQEGPRSGIEACVEVEVEFHGRAGRGVVQYVRR